MQTVVVYGSSLRMTRIYVDRRAWAVDTTTFLDSLPIPQAAVLRLLYFERLTGREAAARLGFTVELVRAAAAEGLRRLGGSLTAPQECDVRATPEPFVNAVANLEVVQHISTEGLHAVIAEHEPLTAPSGAAQCTVCDETGVGDEWSCTIRSIAVELLERR